MKRLGFKFILPFLPIFALLVLFLYALISKPFESQEIFCQVNQKLSIKCPTCGITRAVYCVLNGNFKKAFYYHALFTATFIPLTVIFTFWGIKANVSEGRFKFFKFRWTYFYIFLAVTIIFTATRNLTNFIY